MIQFDKSYLNISVLSVLVFLGACSSPPEYIMEGSQDPDVIVDTAPGVDGNMEDRTNTSGVEVVPLNRSSQMTNANTLREGEEDPMKDFQEAETFEPVIYFDLDQYELTDEHTKVIKYFAQEMLDHEELKIKIKGHTDERGSPEYNLALGERRAKSVAEAMMLYGVESSRIEVISYGEEMPVDSASTEQAWKKNRRAELDIY